MNGDNPLMILKEEMDRLKALMKRAAKRIDDIRYADREQGDEELIEQLREAADIT
jgi:hypothetical protein